MSASTATPRKSASRKTPARKAAATAPRPVAVPLEGFAPIRIVTPEQPPEIEMIEIFSIDGKPYCVPKEVSPSLPLRFMKLARQVGSEIAMGALIEEMLGEEAYDALASCKYLKKEQFRDVMELINRHAMGAVEAPKGRSKSA